jgi:hypothetical protein
MTESYSITVSLCPTCAIPLIPTTIYINNQQLVSDDCKKCKNSFNLLLKPKEPSKLSKEPSKLSKVPSKLSKEEEEEEEDKDDFEEYENNKEYLEFLKQPKHNMIVIEDMYEEGKINHETIGFIHTMNILNLRYVLLQKDFHTKLKKLTDEMNEEFVEINNILASALTQQIRLVGSKGNKNKKE